MKLIKYFLFPLLFRVPLWASLGGNHESDSNDHYTISNPLVLLTGASKYEKKVDCLPTVKNEMEILYDCFQKQCGYEVRSTFFDAKGEVFPQRGKHEKKKMDGEWLYEAKLELWLDDQYDYLRTNIKKKKYDALFFIFSGHGSCDKHGEETIITSEYSQYPWRKIENKFCYPSHSDLAIWAGRCPKLFFKLACRGSNDRVVVQTKGDNDVNLASKTYTFYATSTGTVAGASNGVDLANFILKFFTSAVENKHHLSWIDNRLKEKMTRTKKLDAPACYSGLVADKVFFASKKRALDEGTKEAWFEAIVNGDIKEVKRICENYLSVVHAKEEEEDSTALLLAMRNRRNEIASLLVEKGADVNAEDRGGRTALHIAVEYSRKEVVALLLKKGANVHAKDFAVWTALHYAARKGRKKVASLLLESGADVHAKDKDGNTPLHYAAWRGHKGVAKFLVERGADVHAKGNDGQIALFWAARNGHTEVVALLIGRGADVHAKCERDWTALHFAAERGCKDVASLLLERGADVHVKTKSSGQTALHKAAGEGHMEVVALLVKRAAKVHAKDNDGETALHVAARNGHKRVAKFLIDKGADVHAKDKDGNISLQSAARNGHMEVVDLLVERRVQVEAKDNDGQKEGIELDKLNDNSGETALHVAAVGGSKQEAPRSTTGLTKKVFFSSKLVIQNIHTKIKELRKGYKEEMENININSDESVAIFISKAMAIEEAIKSSKKEVGTLYKKYKRKGWMHDMREYHEFRKKIRDYKLFSEKFYIFSEILDNLSLVLEKEILYKLDVMVHKNNFSSQKENYRSDSARFVGKTQLFEGTSSKRRRLESSRFVDKQQPYICTPIEKQGWRVLYF